MSRKAERPQHHNLIPPPRNSITTNNLAFEAIEPVTLLLPTTSTLDTPKGMLTPCRTKSPSSSSPSSASAASR